MRALSAVDSVSVAIQRTREFLFRPFRWGTYLKLGLVAIITEGSSSNMPSSSHGGGQPSGHGPLINTPFDIPAAWIAMGVAAVLLAMLLTLVVFYLITRLRFAFFHCLVYNHRDIKPGWRLYREPATRFFWLNVVVGLCFLLVVVLVALPFAAGFWQIFREVQSGHKPDIALLLTVVLPLIPIIVLLALAGIVTDLVLRDWMMPHFAFDNATAGEAWRQVWTSIRAETRQFLVYALLRVVLPTVAMAAVFMVLLIPGLMLAGALAAIGYGIHSAFTESTGTAAVAGLILQGFFGVVAGIFALFASVCVGAPVSTGIREYALTFYGGRYPALGAVLDAPVPELPPETAPGLA